MKILIKVQYGRNDYEDVLVDEFDCETINKIKLHNKKINHEVYVEKKIESLYTVEMFESEIGHEIEDVDSDPFRKYEEAWYEEKDRLFNKGLMLLGQAIGTLTPNEQLVIAEIKKSFKKINYTKIAIAVGFSDVGAKKLHMSALRKLRLFFRLYPEFGEYFPNLFKD